MTTPAIAINHHVSARLLAEAAELLSTEDYRLDDLWAEHSGEVGEYLASTLRRGLDWSADPKFWLAPLEQHDLGIRSDADLVRHVADVQDAFSANSPERIAAVFTSIVIWADRNDRPGTAISFAQAAARIAPDNAVAAWQLGMFARRRADHIRARRWYRLAIRFGESQKQWVPVARSWLGLYNLLSTLKHHRFARLAATRALRIARLHKMREVEAEALHGLAVNAFSLGHTGAGVVLAERALDAYGDRRDKVAVLASDIAWYWMVSEGNFAGALELFQARLHEVQSSFERLALIANIARSAGAAGNRVMLEWALARVWGMIDVESSAGAYGGSDALLDVAHGAASIGWMDEAERAVEGAFTVAQIRDEPLRNDAEGLRESIQGKRNVAAQRRVRRDHAGDPGVEQLTDRLVRVLRDTKVDIPLQRLIQNTPSGSTEPLPLEVECDPQDREALEAMLTQGDGKIIHVVVEPALATIYAEAALPVFAALVEHPGVRKIGMMVRYGLR